MRIIRLSDGSEWACNREGEGLFSRRQDGTWQQHEGTGQTGRPFQTPQQFSRYVHARYRDGHLAKRLPRMVGHAGW